MLKRLILFAVVAVLLAMQVFVGNATATELSPDVRTVKLNEQGDTTVLSLEQVKKGKELFIYACSQCHLGGITKPDPNIGLDLETLSLATPPRNNIEALVDYLKNPTTFDGEVEIAELHPSIKSADIFTEMRNMTEDDLVSLSGHILLQPKVAGSRWAGSKARR